MLGDYVMIQLYYKKKYYMYSFQYDVNKSSSRNLIG